MTSSALPGDFPADVDGMATIDIAQAQALLSADRLDGRAVAIRGYWISTPTPSCPWPGRWVSPLETWCGSDTFSDVGYQGWTCTATSCSTGDPPPGAHTISPDLVRESAGADLLRASSNLDEYPSGVPSVLIVHRADPRYLQCLDQSRSECQAALVVDRVAWAAGSAIDLALPDDPYAPKPGMTIGDVEAIIGTRPFVSATVVAARDATNTDPRLHAIGDQLMWVLRSVRSSDDPSDPTRAVDVAMVADVTGAIEQSVDLALGPDYEPGLFRPQSVEYGLGQNENDAPVYRVELPDGTFVLEGTAGDSVTYGSGDRTRHLAGPAAVLEPGDYVVRAWREPYVSGEIAWGTPADDCSAAISITAGEEKRLEAAFPKTGPCSWREPTFGVSVY